MSAVSSAKGKRTDPMSKKIPQNPKYKDVRATVDTGKSMSKYLAKIEDLRTNYRFRNNELFRRMKVTTFVQLILQVNSVNDFLGGGDTGRPVTGLTEDELARLESPAPSLTESDYGAPPDSARSTLQSVIRGVGEIDIDNPDPPAPVNNSSSDPCPYLLLDLRDKDAYDECHIISALNFPIAILSRSCNFETKELLAYKNQTGKIVVVYDEDERISHKAASTMVERGYDNLFMLSGGLKLVHKLFPTGLITGTVPASIAKPGKAPREPATQTHFTGTDIENLYINLEEADRDKSIGTRLSGASTAASRMTGKASQMSNKAPSTARSTMSQMSSASTITGRPAFK